MLETGRQITPCEWQNSYLYILLMFCPVAVMARPVAGVRKKSIIITLPGSPKGAKESLEAIIKLLPHACYQAAGMDTRELHAGGIPRLEREAGLTSHGQEPGTSE